MRMPQMVTRSACACTEWTVWGLLNIEGAARQAAVDAIGAHRLRVANIAVAGPLVRLGVVEPRVALHARSRRQRGARARASSRGVRTSNSSAVGRLAGLVCRLRAARRGAALGQVCEKRERAPMPLRTEVVAQRAELRVRVLHDVALHRANHGPTARAPRQRTPAGVAPPTRTRLGRAAAAASTRTTVP
jgi:hypothetical protein